MKPATYRKLRQKVGSQAQVARLTERDPSTISRRERGTVPIEREAALAIRWLAERNGK